MAAISWFANSAQATVTNMVVGILKNVTITPHFEEAELYGIGSVLRQDIARYGFYVDVTAEVASWDPTETLTGTWLYGEAGGSTLQDTTTSTTVTVTATLKDTAGNSNLTIVVEEVYFPEMPLEGRENEFITRNLKGKGSDFTLTYS